MHSDDLLADLQAGLLDGDSAAALRRRARTDPELARRLAALDRVRRDMADLAVDAGSARDVPAAVTARIGTALRNEPTPTRPPASRFRRAAAAAGITAAVAAAAVGTTMLIGHDSLDGGTAASHPSGAVPLADDQILDLLAQPPDLGVLGNPQRRVSCLSGLGYPTSTSPLGARQLAVSGKPGVLLLLPGDTPNRITAVVVAPNCSSVDTGLLASTVVTRP